uniref:Barttin n=1 Tax=Monopterus albus TaxID=43700 RepID=A0A3Q3J2C8_MONAL
MAEGKPYRYGLIATGLCVVAVGLFIMTQERPHIYATMCVLGVAMVCVGSVWSLCQCYPKDNRLELDFYFCPTPPPHFRFNFRHADALPVLNSQKPRSSRLLPETLKSQCHSCPTLHLV